MKKFKEFFRKLLDRDVIVAVLVVVALGMHYYYFNYLLFSKPVTPTWIDVINSMILLISLTTFSGLMYIWFFYLLTKDAEFIESWVLKNLTKVCYFIGILLIISFILKYLSKELFLTSFGALVVFWYGYKRYERDKEIELIKYYSEKYNIINNEIKNINEEGSDLLIMKFSELINLWYSEYHLWKEGYVSDKLWNDWEYWIKSDIFLYICEGAFGYQGKYGGNYVLDKSKGFDIYFIRALTGLSGAFKFSKEKKYGDLSWRDFLLMLLPTINDCYDSIKKNVKDDIKKTPGYELIDVFFQALNSDLKN